MYKSETGEPILIESKQKVNGFDIMIKVWNIALIGLFTPLLNIFVLKPFTPGVTLKTPGENDEHTLSS